MLKSGMYLKDPWKGRPVVFARHTRSMWNFLRCTAVTDHPKYRKKRAKT
jgi:hypothetical protein